MIWCVFCNISIKRSSLPSMSSARRLHYEGIIYRFKFLMLATLICAALTIAGFIIGQMSESQYRLDDSIHLEFTSAFFTGVYGMWNIYIFSLIILYAPSHKQWPSTGGNGTTSNNDSATGKYIHNFFLFFYYLKFNLILLTSFNKCFFFFVHFQKISSVKKLNSIACHQIQIQVKYHR